MYPHKEFLKSGDNPRPIFEPFLDFDPVLEGPVPHELPPAGRERRRVMQNAILITHNDLLHLADVLRQSRRLWGGLDALEAKLKQATILAHDDMPHDIVRMNSLVTFRDILTGEIEQYWLVDPEQADLDQHRLSVFSAVGTALLGASQGSTVWWDMPSGGKRSVTIIGVRFDPQPRDAELVAS
jgi:regulator of nucleoside diphosphate kinase